MKLSLRTLLVCLPALLAFTGCADPSSEPDPGESDEELVAGVPDDNLNGLWVTTIDGQKQPESAVLESWPAVGIKLHVGTSTYSFSRSGDALSEATGGSLTVLPNKAGVADDVIQGTLGGKTIKLERDMAPKPPIVLNLPGDRPYRSFLNDMIIPAAQRDRESYTAMKYTEMAPWLKSCELYKHGSWFSKYMKGATYGEQAQSFSKIVSGVNGQKTTPRQMTKNFRFYNGVNQNIKDPSVAGLAVSTFGMYFSTAAGRSVRIPITSDSMAYFITDRPERAEKIGVVAMATPLHGPLASTFGRQLLDMGAMVPADDAIYARTMMEMLAKSDVKRASQLSPAGRSALTDWYAVMAIEDYRGVAFGNPDLGWGYNMTNVQFYGLVVRALARPGQMDSAGKPVLGQVIVGSQLKPGDPSYADVLNGGNDMREYPDMSLLKTLTTKFLREKHPDAIGAVDAAFAGVVPKAQLDYRAQADVFHQISAELYDRQGRTANLTGAVADRAVDAVTNLFAVIAQDSAGLEAYILSHGVTKNNDPATKSTGF